jgi:hypothetical protein
LALAAEPECCADCDVRGIGYEQQLPGSVGVQHEVQSMVVHVEVLGRPQGLN